MKPDKEQKEYWNSVADHKEFTVTLNKETIYNYIRPEDYIVDFGCGYGRILNELYSMGYRNSVGYDFSEKLIERGKRLYPCLNLEISANNKVNIPDNSADLVILFAVLTCIIDNHIQKDLINEMKRICKRGGYLYINDFLLNDDERNKIRYGKYKEKYNLYGIFELPEGVALRHHDEEWIINLLSGSGFEIIENNKQRFKTMNGNFSNGISIFAKLSVL